MQLGQSTPESPGRRPPSRLKRRVQQAAFGVAMLVAGAIAIVELAVTLKALPSAARDANETSARLLGTYLSASLEHRVGEILRLADSSLVWTALSDSRERDVYLKPFLEERNQALSNSRLALLDYRGRFVAGDESLLAANGARVKNMIDGVIVSGVPVTRLIVVPSGRLWVAVPIDFPYTPDVIGVLLGVIDLQAMVDESLATDLLDQRVVIGDGDTRLVLRGSDESEVYAAASARVQHSAVAQLYDLELEVHSVTNPWRRGLAVRAALFTAVSITLAVFVWWIAGIFARPVSRRLERLAEVILANPNCGPEDIPADPSGDEIGVLGEALREALLARQLALRKLEKLAYFDELTGLMNRVRFEDRLTEALQRAQRAGTQVALLFIDLDRFKAINDTLGHKAGDALLREVARRISERVRSSDAVSRRGGDEFTLLIESFQDQKGVAQLAEDLIVCVSEPYRLDSGATLVVGASVGIAFYPTDAKTGGTLLQCADTAMYAAKKSGSGNYRIYTPGLGKTIRDRLDLETRLRRAVSEERLEILFQPQVRLADGCVLGVEALCRWYDPELGEIAPAVFIPIAEEVGLIHQIGFWLLRQACREVATWDRPESGLFLAVNVSTRQLTADFTDFIGEMSRTCDRAGLRLELELSELALMHAQPEAVAELDALNDLGVSMVIDNFGSRYLSLYSMKRVTFSKLKIDLSLVANLAVGDQEAFMVATLINLCHELGLEVIAQGVETDVQHDILRDLGCDMAQGYLLGSPVDSESMRERLRAGAGQRLWPQAPTAMA